MKTIKLLALSLIVIFTTAIFFTSCTKKESNKTYSYRAAQDNATAEAIFSRSYNQISKAARYVGSKSIDTVISGCPTITITGSGWPKTITLDFGTSCTSPYDGITRRGQIISQITGLYVDSNSVITSTFSNYYETINGVDHQIQGTQVIKNLGHNQAGHPHFSVDVQGASITFNEGTIHWTSQRENEWIKGDSSLMNPFDDQYLISGTANGTDINGAAFTVNITTPLLWMYCNTLFTWVVSSGKLNIVNSGYPTITVDYGDGSCDFSINIIINGVTYPYVYV